MRLDTFSPMTPQQSSEGVFYDTHHSGFTKLGQIYEQQDDPKVQYQIIEEA